MVAASGSGKRKRTVRTTKKRQAGALEGLPPDELQAGVSAFVSGLGDKWSAEKGGDSVLVLGEKEQLAVGIPFPSFILEYAFQLTCFPLGRIAQVVGVEGTMKSAFCFELARWFHEYGGFAVLGEHESKLHMPWARSIIGWDVKRPFIGKKLDSVNEWQKFTLGTLNQFKDAMLGDKERAGLGKVFPGIWLIDSVMGKGMEETQNKIVAAGFADRSFPAEALSITGFMRTLPSRLAGWPFSLVAVNHLKPSQTSQGITVRNKAGGRGLSFQETFEIELSRSNRGFKIDNVKVKGRRLLLTVYKNSMGPDRISIPVDVVWWHEEVFDVQEERRTVRQRTVWDWHSATIHWLMRQEGVFGKAVKEIVDLTACKNNTKVYSRALGISPKSPEDFATAGAMLTGNTEVLEALRDLFCIQRIKAFEPGVDFDQQMRLLKTELGRGPAEKKAKGRKKSPEATAPEELADGDEGQEEEQALVTEAESPGVVKSEAGDDDAEYES